jgi:hypothetical protein
LGNPKGLGFAGGQVVAPNTVSIGSLSKEIEQLKSHNRALIGLVIEVCRVTYANAKTAGAPDTTLTLLKQNGEMLKRLMDP